MNTSRFENSYLEKSGEGRAEVKARLLGPFLSQEEESLFYAFQCPKERSLCSCMKVYPRRLCLWHLTWTGWRRACAAPLSAVEKLVQVGDRGLALYLREDVYLREEERPVRMVTVRPAARVKAEIEFFLEAYREAPAGAPEPKEGIRAN